MTFVSARTSAIWSSMAFVAVKITISIPRHRLTASVGSTYHFPVGIAGVSGVFGTNVDYTSTEILRSLSGSLLTATESANIFLTGARLGLEADHWSTELYGDNLFNNREAETPPDINVDLQSVRLRPRTIGMRANYKF